MNYEIQRSEVLNNIPQRKLHSKIFELITNCKVCSTKNIKSIEQVFDSICEKCSISVRTFNRYYEANIPLLYWDLNMTDFVGSKVLLEAYNNYINNITNMYDSGFNICFASPHGNGKTTIGTNILKFACKKNYKCCYTNLGDIVDALINSHYDQKPIARKELFMIDFLMIDEFDPRWFNGENSSDLFGKTLELVLRVRLQNKLPTILCSNSPNPIEAFSGQIKESMDSIMSNVKIISTIGEDFRKSGYNVKLTNVASR